MTYQCEHIEAMIRSHNLQTEDGMPILHELYKDGYYWTTRERDRTVKCIYCPICGKVVDAEAATLQKQRIDDTTIKRMRTRDREKKHNILPILSKGRYSNISGIKK